MTSKITKRWSVNVVSEGQLPLRYYCDGRPLTQAGIGTIEHICPVEHLLMAVSSCFALSCRAVLARRRLPRLSFEVVTSGIMAEAAVNRLSGVAIVAIFHDGLPESEAVSVVEEAKPPVCRGELDVEYAANRLSVTRAA